MAPTLRLSYVGHACLLIEIGPLRVLTDPVLRPRIAHLRRIAPPVRPEILERIDLVLVSHAHHDHLDVRSLRLLEGSPPVLCPGPAVPAVERAGLRASVVTAGESVERESLRIEVTAANHDGRRWGPMGNDHSVGFVLRGAGLSVYFAGDTDLFDEMRLIERIDVALLPVAGWGPNLGAGHLDPAGAARAAEMIGPRIAVPIHWGSYRRMMMSGTESADAPARSFAAELAKRAPAVRAELIEPGHSRSFA